MIKTSVVIEPEKNEGNNPQGDFVSIILEVKIKAKKIEVPQMKKKVLNLLTVITETLEPSQNSKKKKKKKQTEQNAQTVLACKNSSTSSNKNINQLKNGKPEAPVQVKLEKPEDSTLQGQSKKKKKKSNQKSAESQTETGVVPVNQTKTKTNDSAENLQLLNKKDKSKTIQPLDSSKQSSGNLIGLTASEVNIKCLDCFNVIEHLVTSKAANKELNQNNTIVCGVHINAKKHHIRSAMQALYGVEVLKVKFASVGGGKKNAHILLPPDHNALDISNKIKIITDKLLISQPNKQS